MHWIRWGFIALNVVYPLMCLKWVGETNLAAYGKAASVSLSLWQISGAVAVACLGFSAWHLVWWFVLGYALMLMAVRIMNRMGLDTM